jgi:hypothetical protein
MSGAHRYLAAYFRSRYYIHPQPASCFLLLAGPCKFVGCYGFCIRPPLRLIYTFMLPPD